VYRDILSKDAVRLLRASGSPRAFSPRDDKGGYNSSERKLRFVPPASFSIFTLHPSIHWQSVDRYARKGLAMTKVHALAMARID